MTTESVSHYRILDKLGSGGMADVYLAEDTKLDRTVALKMLSSRFTEDEELRQRLVREAKAASALSHPNLAHVYEIGESNGDIYIAMEYVKGETLVTAGTSRRVGPWQAVDIGLQVAEALAEAHTHGIIHRDIKPGNIVLTPKGQVKVLDFGLAKIAARTVDAARNTDHDTWMKSTPGTLLGTVPYMSPEQARGEEVDERTDIFSLGVVIYELVTGTHPFYGPTFATVFDSILNKQPEPASRVNRSVPPELDGILSKALEKDRSLRHPSVVDFRNDLWRVKRNSDVALLSATETSENPRQRSSLRRAVALGAIVALLLFSSVALVYDKLMNPTGGPRFSRLTALTGGVGYSNAPSWSPDGNWIAYAASTDGQMDVWKARLDVGAPAVRLTNSAQNELGPSWSPDGRSVAFSRDGKEGGIFLVPANGGAAFRLTEFGESPRWSPGGDRIAFESNSGIYTVPAGGGRPRRVVRPSRNKTHLLWSRDGSKLIYWDFGKNDVYVVAVSGGAPKSLGLVPAGQEVAGLSLSSDGRSLIFSRGPFGGPKDLWRIAYDSEGDRLIGEPSSLLTSLTDDIECAISPDGRKIAFTARQLERRLWSFSRNPVTGTVRGEPKPLPSQGRLDYYPSLSPNGQRLVWTSHRGNQGVLYVKDLGDESPAQKLTQDWGRSTREVGAFFSPDGNQLSYSSTVGGSYQIWRLPVLGSVALQVSRVVHPVSDNFPAWSPTGDALVAYSNRSGDWDIWAFDIENQVAPRALTGPEANDTLPAWSPDGRFIAYQSDRDGSLDIWRMKANGEDPEPYVTSSAEEGWGAWSPDGRFFYFTSNRSGSFDIWLREDGPEQASRITSHPDPAFGLPEISVFTKFAVSDDALIVPLESRLGDIYILEAEPSATEVAAQ